MDQQWTEITDSIRSSDPDQVNDVIDRLKEMDRDHRLQLFDTGFDDLATIYSESDDGYVRQSVVRVVDQVTPGLAVVFILVDEDGATQETRETIKKRLDTAAGFLIETLEDDDGRVRQSAKRALKDVYRGYEALEETETIAAVASELDSRADEYEDKRRDHLLDSKADAEFFCEPVGTRMIENIHQVARSHDPSSRE
ncbi:hypothetical protein [Halopenitus sp. POP-27]|uniref:hypothetical protein n=1 Tax=Halopenitus sp. POP-27 TaxID=2994425 RepID=UPI00246846C0|nr:hypothetical protein [Halopenitus sp. POP-27]